MDKAQKLAIVETSLERAAEQLGDISTPVMERYYLAFPDAQTSFEEHGLGNTAGLEAEMLDSVLYCLMNWLDRPEEIRIMFGSTVPHHEDALHVRYEWFSGLVAAAYDIIVETIPHDQAGELEVWQEIGTELQRTIAEARDV